ncbi:mechanosensitive ion channel family protein [Myceligenerans pegani]|uniref:Mechanosensitive ion channel family protein n=1 Tax=Myceligenerans pegani TaxID=2776917 RepID=A0ABR9N2S4_9MICO|nr:mechanosensitive ion channel family protein [Myceligenerans sp. TRM 65318]MBE1877312.1 mechanosensitive ion channel family protein [Myceligenerans sp. TRM 65318]MBE3019583.1 mechanosensitive ion channel family protein [Myceligenerans sp. TRM 65318]
MNEEQLAAAFFDGAEGFWDWFVDKPLNILIILVVSVVALVLTRRLITHLTERIAAGVTRDQERAVRAAAAEASAAAVDTAHKRRRKVRISPQALGEVLAQTGNGPTADRRAQRARTVGSVLNSTANIAIGVFAVLSIASVLEIDLTGLIAGAGIVGVAIGFGAQSLVKDFLSGIFLLIEDQFGVGDFVDLGGGVTGTVEAMGLRLTQVRNFDGTLWYVRNGEILRAGNSTQEWSRAVAPILVPVGSDVEAVRAALGRAVDRVQEDPETSSALLEAPSVRGVDNVDAFTLTFTLHAQVRPGEQWLIARALRVSAQEELLREGIVVQSIPANRAAEASEMPPSES